MTSGRDATGTIYCEPALRRKNHHLHPPNYLCVKLWYYRIEAEKQKEQHDLAKTLDILTSSGPVVEEHLVFPPCV